MQLTKAQRPQTAATVGGHIVGEHRIGQQGHVTKDVMENVGLAQIVQLICVPNEPTGGKAPVRQMVEEDHVGHETGHSDDCPPGQPLQLNIDLPEIRNAGAVQIQHLKAS